MLRKCLFTFSDRGVTSTVSANQSACAAGAKRKQKNARGVPRALSVNRGSLALLLPAKLLEVALGDVGDVVGDILALDGFRRILDRLAEGAADVGCRNFRKVAPRRISDDALRAGRVHLGLLALGD